MSPKRKLKVFYKNEAGKVKSLSILLLLIIAGLSAVFVFNPSTSPDVVSAATVDQFSYYKEITLNSSQVPSTLTNFPVLINLSSDADLAADALSSGDDIAFFDDSNTQLNHEIELFDDATGQLVVWVNITSLAHDADTVIYMYYGDADIGSSAENVTGTWHSNYLFVSHFADASGGLVDSTSNNNDFTEYGNPTYRQNSDITGYEITFDGTGDYFEDADNSVWDRISSNDEISVFVVADYNTGNSEKPAFIQQYKQRDETIGYSWRVSQDPPDGEIDYFIMDDTDSQSTLFLSETLSSYEEVIIYATAYSGNLYGRADGETDSTTLASIKDSSIDIQIGALGKSDSDYDGSISEIRVASPAFSTDYMDTYYNNLNNATDGGFFSLSSEQEDTPGTYEISGLDTNTQFTFSGEAGTMVWANDTGDTYETLAIHTNLSGTTANCTDIFLDFSTWIDADLDEETLNISIARTTGDFAGNVYQVPNGGNVTINNSVWTAQVWCQGTNPFDTNSSIDGVNRTFYVRVRQTIPSGKSTGTYEVTSASATVNVLWKTIS